MAVAAVTLLATVVTQLEPAAAVPMPPPATWDAAVSNSPGARRQRFGAAVESFTTTSFLEGGVRANQSTDGYPAHLPPPAEKASRGRNNQLWQHDWALTIPAVGRHMVMGGLAKSTTSKYQKGFEDFTLFTERMNGSKKGGEWSSLLTGQDPVRDEEHLINFVAYQGWYLGLAHSTVQGKLSGVRWQHMNNGLPNPLEGKPRLKSALKHLKKLRGEGAGKLPVSPDLLRMIKADLDFTRDEDILVWNGLMFGFFFLMRSSEYLADGVTFNPQRGVTTWKVLTERDNQPTDDWRNADSLTVLFEVTKTDQARAGCTRTVYASGLDLCVVEAYKMLRERREATGTWQPDDPLMMAPDGFILSREYLSDVIKRAAVRCGLNLEDYASHSLRKGGATALFHAGWPDEHIRRFGRWVSDCWKRYVYSARRDMAGASTDMASSNFTVAMAATDFVRASSFRPAPTTASASAGTSAQLQHVLLGRKPGEYGLYENSSYMLTQRRKLGLTSCPPPGPADEAGGDAAIRICRWAADHAPAAERDAWIDLGFQLWKDETGSSLMPGLKPHSGASRAAN